MLPVSVDLSINSASGEAGGVINTSLFCFIPDDLSINSASGEAGGRRGKSRYRDIRVLSINSASGEAGGTKNLRNWR